DVVVDRVVLVGEQAAAVDGAGAGSVVLDGGVAELNDAAAVRQHSGPGVSHHGGPFDQNDARRSTANRPRRPNPVAGVAGYHAVAHRDSAAAPRADAAIHEDADDIVLQMHPIEDNHEGAGHARPDQDSAARCIAPVVVDDGI